MFNFGFTFHVRHCEVRSNLFKPVHHGYPILWPTLYARARLGVSQQWNHIAILTFIIVEELTIYSYIA